jgi:uncharacterized OsmC-like protein/pimeloyl-ACP methyl ester carboxylesterase
MTSSEKITFTGSHGEQLAGRLDLPSQQPRAYALFAHCFTCSKDLPAASRISRALAAQGFGVLRFDFTGLGGSEGEFGNTNFSSNVQDLIAAANHLREKFEAPQLLVGHSLGGAAVLVAAHEIPECKAVATLGAPGDPAHVQHLLAESVEEIQRKGHAEVTLAGRKFVIKRQFLDDLRRQEHEHLIERLKRALLVFHSPTDDIVGIDNARLIFKAARHPKSFVSLDGADHLLTRAEDAEYVGTVLSAWASRYLSAAGAPQVGPEEEVLHAQGHGRGLVRESGDGKFRQAMRLGSHLLYADEPVSVGGDDTGPSPYELLLGALGSCTTMTLRMYADRKKWPLERATVALRHDKRHADDCEDCEKKDVKIDHIEREITLEGQLSDEQRRRLLEIADRCPVHRTLHSEIRIDTRERKPE